MKKFLLLIYIIFSVILLFYVALPTFDFPKPPPDFARSKEPADTEDTLRRAYFTDMTRQEVLDWYMTEFKNSSFQNIPLPTYLLNYPPENSGRIIRDQTRSTFLQEIVHPFRETVFINGYEPGSTDYQNKIVIDGVHYRQKIIIKYTPSNLILRLTTSLLTLIAIPVLWQALVPELIFFKKIFKKIKSNSNKL